MIDIFAGSNTTGQAAEMLGRQWLAFELEPAYVATSAFRFTAKSTPLEQLQRMYDRIMSGETVDMEREREVAGTHATLF